MNEREYEELAAEHDPSVEDETREETDRMCEEAMDFIDYDEIVSADNESSEHRARRSKGYEIEIYITDPAGNHVAGPYETMEEAEQWLDDAEPFGAGSDPFGRPDPQTHPEFWTE